MKTFHPQFPFIDKRKFRVNNYHKQVLEIVYQLSLSNGSDLEGDKNYQ